MAHLIDVPGLYLEKSEDDVSILSAGLAHIDECFDRTLQFWYDTPTEPVANAHESIQLRRSIFGYFCRRCFVSFVKLSFSAVVNLTRDYQAWTAGNLRAGYGPLPKEHIYNGMHIAPIFYAHPELP